MIQKLELFDKVIVISPCNSSINKIGEIGYITHIIKDKRLLGIDANIDIFRFSFTKEKPNFHEPRYDQESAFKIIEKHNKQT